MPLYTTTKQNRILSFSVEIYVGQNKIIPCLVAETIMIFLLGKMEY